MHLTTNQAGVLNMLANSFTGRKTFIGELIQNARRAGATFIKFSLQSDNYLVVKDNGCGVADFNKLLTMCESGWSEEVRQRDEPYGVGFLSAILASEHFSVASHGQVLEAYTAKLLAGERAHTYSAANKPGTEIRLKLKSGLSSYDLSYHMKQLAAGCEIDVFLEEQKLETPLRLQGQQWAEPIPDVGVLIWNEELASRMITSPRYFLQGLPIKVVGASNSDYGEWAVHLNSPQYRGRMPDRDQVIDLDYVEIKSKVEEATKRLISRWFDTLDGCPSYEQYRFLSYNYPELLDRVKVIPVGVFGVPDNVTEVTSNRCREVRQYDQEVTPEDTDFRYVKWLSIDDGLEVALAQLLDKLDIPMTTELRLPSWVLGRRIEYDCVELSPVGEHHVYHGVRTGLHHNLSIYDGVSAVGVTLYDGDEVLLSGEIDCSIYDSGELYLIGDPDHGLFYQDLNYQDDSESWDEERIAEDLESLEEELTLLRGGDITELIRKALETVAHRPSLHLRSYKVTFNNIQATKVEEIK